MPIDLFPKPDPVFKFGKFEHLEKTLNEKKLRFAALRTFNDITELDFNVNILIDNDSELELSIHLERELSRKVREFLDRGRVTCFSLSPYSHLMWAHYSENHHGICYEFDLKYLIRDSRIKHDKVSYSSTKPELSYYRRPTSDVVSRSHSEKIIFTKASDWSYEKEYRLLNFDGLEFMKFPATALKSVIVGAKMGEHNLEQVRKIVERYGRENDCEATIKYAGYSDTEYSMIISDNPRNREVSVTGTRWSVGSD